MTIATKAWRREPRGASSGRPRAPSRGAVAAEAAATGRCEPPRGLGRRPRSGIRGARAYEPRDSPGRVPAGHPRGAGRVPSTVPFRPDGLAPSF